MNPSNAVSRSVVPEEIRILADGLATAVEACRPIYLKADGRQWIENWSRFCTVLHGTKNQLQGFQHQGVAVPTKFQEAVELLDQQHNTYGLRADHADKCHRPKDGYVQFCDWESESQRALAMLAPFRPTKAPVDEGPWSNPDSPSRWAKVFKMSTKTFLRHVKTKAIHAKKLSDKSYQVALPDIPKPQASPPS